MARNNPTNPLKEQEQLLKQALHAFQATTDMDIRVLKAYRPEESADAEIRLEGGQKLLVEVKRNVTPATIGAAAQVAVFTVDL